MIAAFKNWAIAGRLAALITVLSIAAGTVALAETAPQHPNTVRIGILTKGNPELTLKRWPATADYLNRAIPNRHFEIVALDFRDTDAAVREKRIDFLFTNPANYVELEGRYGIHALLTLQRKLSTGDTSTFFAGVILVRADRTDIQRFADLRGKHFAAVDKDSFGGWAMAWRQMQLVGLSPLDDLASIDFLGSHEDVVRAVISGAEDAGTVSTGILEHMVASGELHAGDFRVLPEESTGVHQPEEFPLLHSTLYYPEWPLARLAHVDDQLAKEVTMALLAMSADDQAAIAAGIAGWIAPLSYRSVHELMKDLRLAQYRHFGQVPLWDAIKQYWYWVMTAVTIVITMSMIIIYVISLNQRNSQTNRELQKELDEKGATQHELMTQKERLTSILESIAEGYFAVDADWRVTTINTLAEEVLSAGDGPLKGRDLWAALPELATIAYSSFSRSLELGEPFEFTAFYRATDQWLEFHTYPSGEELGIYFRDVTSRIKASAQLEESEQRLRAILENMLEGVITADFRGTIRSVNKAAQVMFGYNENEMVGKSLDILMPPAIKGVHTRYIGNYLEGGQAKVIGVGRELTGLRKHGEAFPLDISISEILVNGQRMFVGICRDISARKKSEARTTQLATAIDHAAEGVFIAGADGNINYINPAYAQMRGEKAAALLGRKATLFEMIEQAPDSYREARQALHDSVTPWHGNYPVQHSNGIHYIEEATIAPVQDEHGAILCYVGVCRDVTRKLHNEQQLRQAARTEATATMALGIAHEFNAILEAIIDHTNVVLTKTEPHSVAGKAVTQVLGAANRARILARQLINFGQQEYEQPQLLHPYEVVKSAIALMQSVLPSTVYIKQHLAEELGNLWIAPGQFQQIIMNLVLNTIRTVNDSPGMIEITLERRHLMAEDEETRTGLAPGEYMALHVSDSSSLKRHDVSPTSISLSDDMELNTVQAILQRNGGALFIETLLGKGTTFRIYLPLVKS